jgi:hypothetical protein
MNDNTATSAAVSTETRARSYPRTVTPKTIKEGKNKNGTEFVSFIGEYRRQGKDKVYTMFHTASGAALSSIREQLKEGQPIRVFGVFDEMPADAERKSKQVFRIIGLSTPRELVVEEMQQAA